MCLPEDMLQAKRVSDDMNQTGSPNIMLVWNSCWPDGVLMGTFICFFITTKMSYILTPLLPLFPKGCQRKSHYNMTAGGNFFSPSHIISSNDSVKRERTWIQKLPVKEQCSVTWAEEAFLNACHSPLLLLTESNTHTARVRLGTGCLCCAWHGEEGLRTGTLQHSPHSRKWMGDVCATLPDHTAEGLHWGDKPHLCVSSHFWLTWEHKVLW